MLAKLNKAIVRNQPVKGPQVCIIRVLLFALRVPKSVVCFNCLTAALPKEILLSFMQHEIKLSFVRVASRSPVGHRYLKTIGWRFEISLVLLSFEHLSDAPWELITEVTKPWVNLMIK